jgi:hypothetical protein
MACDALYVQGVERCSGTFFERKATVVIHSQSVHRLFFEKQFSIFSSEPVLSRAHPHCGTVVLLIWQC